MQRKEKEVRKKLRYDQNDGLLPEIRRVCGYPDHIVEEICPRGGAKRKKQVEEEWKWVEAQICGVCSAGGDILCCEDCPASFHLSCVGYEASDVPDESFYCNRCQNLPDDVHLFPPEKCAPDPSPQHRIERENNRNWEAIEFHFNASESKQNEVLQKKLADGEVEYGPLTERETFKRIFPTDHLLKALSTANVKNVTLPAEFLLEREFYPNDPKDERRPKLCGEVCAECELKDDWTAMLNCDFCELVWHQKCVYPPLINIPRLSYWMCPRHPEIVIDSLLLGEGASRYERDKLYRKYRTTEDPFEIFEKFCKATESLRLEAETVDKTHREEIYHDPIDDDFLNDFSSLLIPKKNGRKGGRGKKKNESPYLCSVYQLKLSPDNSAAGKKPRKRTEQSAIQKDEDCDIKTEGVKFTQEELIMSIMPYEVLEKSRNEYLTQRLLGTDIDLSTSFLNRYTSMIARSRHYYDNLSEKELIKLMRRDLDPVESVRGSGTQNICSLPEKTYRKKLKADVELLAQHLGLGDDHINRKFNTARTEAFFRRCAPPPSAQNVLTQRTLREVTLNSQKEALDISKVYKYHSKAKKVEDFVLLAYDTHFESVAERDAYYPSSMTIWSKEPIAALTAKWVAESGGVKIESKSPSPDYATDSPSAEGSPPAAVVTSFTSSMDQDEPVSPKQELESRESSVLSSVETAIEEDTEVQSEIHTEKAEFIPVPLARKKERDDTEDLFDGIGPDVTEEMIEQLALEDFKTIKRPKYYQKAMSFEELCFDDNYENFEAYEVFRITKSMTDLLEVPNWSQVHKNFQNKFQRMHYQTDLEHDYAALGQNPSEFRRLEESYLMAMRGEEDAYYNRATRSHEFLSPEPPHSDYYENFADSSKKRGRPRGSKNRKEGEPVKRKRNSVTSTTSGKGRGRGGRPRGSRGGRGRGSTVSSVDGGGASRRGSINLTSDNPTSPEVPEQSSSSCVSRIEDEVEKIRLKYAKMVIKKELEEIKEDYFRMRDEALQKWNMAQWTELQEKVLAGRLSSLIPFEPRYFLPNQRVMARLVIDQDHLPIAIQRCLTKFGTAHDCHIRTDNYISSFCTVMDDYHCDIVREYHSDVFYLSTLATNAVIVNGVVVRRPRLIPLEAAERGRTKASSSSLPSSIKCICQKYSDQLISRQESSGQSITAGVVELEDGARIQIGCASFTFYRT